jgi:molybdopterin-containing oxidoreductase family membrane subunit
MKISNRLAEGREFYLLMWIAVLLVGVVLGVYGAYHLIVRQEAASISWGLLVPSYVFFALAATGSSLVNSILTVFNVQRFKPIIKRGILLSLILIVPAGIFIILDLGKWFNAYNMYFLFQPGSRMAWMGVLYVIFIVSLILELVVVMREEHMPKWAPRLMGIVVLVVTLAVHTNLGALFGAVAAKPLWSSHLLPIHFIISATLVGAALHILFISVTYLVRRGSVPGELKQLFVDCYRPLMVGLIIINFVLIAIKFIPAAFSPEGIAYVKLMVAGPYSGLFWGLEIAVGCVIPLIILLHRKTRGSAGWLLRISPLVVIGVYFSKYNLLIGGQSIGPLFTENLIPYVPGVADILLFVGGIAACLLVYTLGEMLLPIELGEKPAWFIFVKRKTSLKEGTSG